jgi:hypothetical protein
MVVCMQKCCKRVTARLLTSKCFTLMSCSSRSACSRYCRTACISLRLLNVLRKACSKAILRSVHRTEQQLAQLSSCFMCCVPFGLHHVMLSQINTLFFVMAFHQITDKGKTFTVMAALRRSKSRKASAAAVVPIGVPASSDGVIDITRVEATAMYVPSLVIVV